ncbi:MAG: ABC transporter permease subunit [Planctomycetaceae bacterium]|nr:ABC transporter permease subunit [Planctomycetales bacterium]MCB9920732.1 ABC transporter permease subunit [Planctomycetaceae bacterium]
MFVGPVFYREAETTPRRPRHYMYRTIYVLALLVLTCTAWFVLAGVQIIQTVGDMARFGALLFQILAPVQLALITFLAAFGTASAVSQEKDRRTLILLLMTRLSNSELVIGKLLASLLDVFVMILAALPVFLLITLLGGVSNGQVARVFLITFTTGFAAGSLGSMLGLWREKTFQTLALTALTIVLWSAVWEAVHAGVVFESLGGISCETLATGFSPFRAILAGAQPRLAQTSWISFALDGVNLYLVVSLGVAAALNGWAILRVRVWNPSRELRPGQADEMEQASIWGVEHDIKQLTKADPEKQRVAEAARSGHVDARSKPAATKSREVWDNPILWREVCTWAYGRKVLIIRLAYLVFFAMAAGALYWAISSGAATTRASAGVIPAVASFLSPFFLVSLVIINALAVNSVTNERDGQALDILLATDISPKEFVLGKLWGVLWVTKEMVLLPMALCFVLWWQKGITTENLIFVLGGLCIMDIFVTMLGLHCGMTYSNSRTAIGVSLGSVFFLFVGVVTCLAIMISFSGSFQGQYAPFLAFIGGGSVGLYVALGSRNPSAAIFWASLLLPMATFFAIVSFVLGDRELTIFLVLSGTYGFTTTAMLVPAISEFDFAMGRTRTGGDED